MRVCIFAPALSLWSFGGVAEHTYQLSKHLVKLGCEVHVLCRSVKDRSVHEMVDGIQVHRLVPNNGPTWYLSLKKSVFESFSKQWAFDLFHSQGPCGVLMPVDKPLVVTLHGTSVNEAKEVFRDFLDLPRLGIWNPSAYIIHGLAVPSTYLPGFFLRRIVKKAARIIAVSQFVKEESQKVLHVRPEKMEVVYNGARIEYSVGSKKSCDGALILFVGHLGVRKGLPYLIHAFRTIFEANAHATAAIIGEGPLEFLCRGMAQKLGISHRLIFKGKVTENEKIDWYHRADLCVFPSTYEPFPIVALEALAAGKPVVASNVGGLPELVLNGVDGLLVEPRNPKQIAAAVNSILTNEEWAGEMSKNALKIIKRNHRWESIAEQTLGIYRSCVGEGS